MAGTLEQQMSHADRHDLDKLARWKEGLDGVAGAERASFPVCAIFLVSPEDRAAHDIFRRYRSVFEELGAGFHHLVIFGQHGISTTQVAFLGEVGSEQTSVPLLAIAPTAEGSGTVSFIELPKGDRDGELDDSQTWGTVLRAVQEAASARSISGLDKIEGVRIGGFRRDTLVLAVDAVLSELGEAS